MKSHLVIALKQMCGAIMTGVKEKDMSWVDMGVITENAKYSAEHNKIASLHFD